MFKYLPWIIVAVLLIFLSISILTRPEPQTNGYIKQYESQIQQRDVQLKAKDAQIQTLLNEREKKDSIHAKKEVAFKTQLNAKDSRIDKLIKNPIVIHVRDSVPEVDSLINELQDKIQFQSVYIASLDSAYNDLRGDFETVKDNFESQIELYKANFADEQAINKDYKKQLRKSRRAVKLLKVVAVVGTVGGLFLGSSF